MYAEKQLHLFGTATSAGGGRVADDQATWYVGGKEIAKGFDTACPLSAFEEATGVADPQNLRIRMTVNGEVRQDGNTSMMIHRIPAIVSHMSGCFTLEPGDVILTGTPAGVGRIVPGDRLTAEIPGVATLRVSVA